MNGATEVKEATEGTEGRGRRLRLALLLASVASVTSVASVPSFAAGDFTQAGIGTTGAAELTLPVGARGIAMGEAVSAVADDVTAIHWNPAGLAAIPTGSASFMQSFYLGNINYQYLAFGHRVSESQVLAGSVQMVDYGNIDHRDVNDVSLGSFHPRSTLYSLGFAQNVKEFEESGNLSAGFTAKYLHSTIIESADSYALDVGFRAKLATDEIPTQAAFVVQNLGVGPKYDQRRENLPSQLVGSTAFMPGHWIVSLELIAPRSNQAYGAIGLEYKAGWTRTLNGALRCGYNSLTTGAGPSGLHGFSFGLGAEVTGLSFDYAIVPFGDLGLTHQFSINYSLPKFEED